MINSITRPLNVQELYHRLSPQEDTEDADVDMVKEMLFQCLLDLDEQQQQQHQQQTVYPTHSQHTQSQQRQPQPQQQHQHQHQHQHQQYQYQTPDHSHNTIWWQQQMQNDWSTAAGASQPIYVLKTETLEELLREGLTRQKKGQ